MLKTRIATALAAAAFAVSALSGCFFRERHNCRDHENWDGGQCHAEHGYEHYWDHDDHRDWHPDHHDDDHHEDHH